jgi:hypothetical protein
MAMMGALSSETDRAKSRASGPSGPRSELMSSVADLVEGPSRRTGVNGGLDHCSGRTGWPS